MYDACFKCIVNIYKGKYDLLHLCCKSNFVVVVMIGVGVGNVDMQ